MSTYAWMFRSNVTLAKCFSLLVKCTVHCKLLGSAASFCLMQFLIFCQIEIEFLRDAKPKCLAVKCFVSLKYTLINFVHESIICFGTLCTQARIVYHELAVLKNTLTLSTVQSVLCLYNWTNNWKEQTTVYWHAMMKLNISGGDNSHCVNALTCLAIQSDSRWIKHCSVAALH